MKNILLAVGLLFCAISAQAANTGGFQTVTETVSGLNYTSGPMVGICKPTASLRTNKPSSAWSVTLVVDGQAVVALNNTYGECNEAAVPLSIAGDTAGTATLIDVQGTPPLPLIIDIGQTGILKVVRVRASLIFDDQTEVSGALSIVNPPGMASIAVPLESGLLDYTLLLDPTASYSGVVQILNTNMGEVDLPISQLPLPSAVNSSAMTYINAHIFHLTVYRINGSIAGVSVQ
jgi:hypothetical protein